jgi:hypothetical protein
MGILLLETFLHNSKIILLLFSHKRSSPTKGLDNFFVVALKTIDIVRVLMSHYNSFNVEEQDAHGRLCHVH